MCRGTTNGEDVYLVKEDLIPKVILETLNQGWIRNHGGIPIDLCIGEEVEYLIKSGVRTVGSCCGHDEWQSHVLVFEEELDKVRKLEYTYEEYEGDLYSVFLKSGTQIKS